MLRTLRELLREALPAANAERLESEQQLEKRLALAELAALLRNNAGGDRPAVLARLKEAGVAQLGERQKLTNALAKAERTAKATGCVKRIESELYDCI